MGLDQYLWKSKRIDVYDFKKDEFMAKNIKVKVDVEFADGEVKTKEYVLENPQHDGHIYFPVAYWRKANEIHKWFVDLNDGVDDCKQIHINGSQILSLLDICKQILADHSKAKELLPTQSGFFFGSTDYDEWYYEDLEKTVKMLGDTKEEDEFIYQASW